MKECIDDFDLSKASNVLFHDRSFLKDLKTNKKKQEFLKILVLCHTVVVENRRFNASSPDELALINFAKFCGVQYLGTDSEEYMNISFFGTLKRYLLLEDLEFDSFRK